MSQLIVFFKGMFTYWAFFFSTFKVAHNLTLPVTIIGVESSIHGGHLNNIILSNIIETRIKKLRYFLFYFFVNIKYELRWYFYISTKLLLSVWIPLKL